MRSVNGIACVLAWETWSNPFNTDIYTQKIFADGRLAWDPAGIAISNALEDQIHPGVVSDLEGGIFCAWQDFREDALGDIYAQKVFYTGKLTSVPKTSGIPCLMFPVSFVLLIVLSLVFARHLFRFWCVS